MENLLLYRLSYLL